MLTIMQVKATGMWDDINVVEVSWEEIDLCFWLMVEKADYLKQPH